MVSVTILGGVFPAAQLGQGQTVPRDELQLRIAFANKHFASRSTPGSRTDRGKAYIVLGPPDQISG
jgi:GWxTD domain-containing protein